MKKLLSEITQEEKMMLFQLEYPDAVVATQKKLSAVDMWLSQMNLSYKQADYLRSLDYQIENVYEKEVEEKELKAIWTVATEVSYESWAQVLKSRNFKLIKIANDEKDSN